uniref:Uncharacterized protein n=1 Tax=Daucus carota subsp. sativus TaxID=79200 RepID=A0A164VK14_DAUCS
MVIQNEGMQVEEDIESYLDALKKLYSLLVINNDRQSLQNYTSRDNFVIVSIFGLSFLTRSRNNTADINKQTGEDLKGQVANKRVPDDKPVQSVASVAAELLNRKKRCRICRRSSTKQLKFEHGTSSAVETDDINKGSTNFQHNHQADAHENVTESYSKAILADLSNEKEMQKRVLGFHFNSSGNGALIHSYNRDASGTFTSGALQNSAVGTEKKHKDIYCISKDASDAIKTIESCISALKVAGKQMDSLGKRMEPGQGAVFKFVAGSDSASGTSSPNMGNKAALVSQGDQTQVGPFRLGRNDSQNLWARRTRETKAMTRWRQLSRYIVNPPDELNLPKQLMRSSATLSPWNAKSRSQNFGKDNEINLRANTFSQADELIERKELGLHKASSVHIKNVKTNAGKVESMTQTKKSPHQTNSVQGLRIPLNSEKKNSLLDRSPGKTNKLILDRNLQKRRLSKAVQSQPSIPAVSARNKQIQTQTKMVATSKVLPHRKTMRQTLPYPLRYGDREEIDRGKVKKKTDRKGKQRQILSDQPESNSTNSHGSSSSSWTTQQGSTSYHEDEEYSVSDPSQSSHHSSTSAGSESEGQYVSSSTQLHNTGSPSYSDSQLSSAPSSTHSLEDSKSDGDNVGYLLSHQTSSSEPSYQQGHYSRRYRSTHRKRPRKRTSSLKKLKDKVAIFFHHHHHHHHHHHNSDDSEKSDDLSQAYHGTALSKRDTKMFKRRNQAETSGEKVTEKLSKSMVHYAPNKKRGSNFNKLVGGLVRHVRHPKKSKKSKSSTKHQTKNQHVSKKLAKKVHWWQLLHRRRPRMRMPKKPRIKLGFGTKRSKLKAVPTLKWH